MRETQEQAVRVDRGIRYCTECRELGERRILIKGGQLCRSCAAKLGVAYWSETLGQYVTVPASER